MQTKNIHISVNSWVMEQQPTPLSLRKRSDCYDQRCVKFNGVGVFHSRAELLHAALLEGDPLVSAYIPQPTTFRIGRRLYTPDSYIHQGTKKIIRELKPRGEFEYPWRLELENYCAFHDHLFEVTANEWVFDQEQLAENWLSIMRILARNRHAVTDAAEMDIMQNWLPTEGATFASLVDHGDSTQKFLLELAVLRLLHRGRLKAALNYHPFDHDTVFESCI